MNLIHVTQQQPETYPPEYLTSYSKVSCRPFTYVMYFAMVIVFCSVFEKDPNGVDSTASSSHRTRNLLEFSASQESSTAQKIPGHIIPENR